MTRLIGQNGHARNCVKERPEIAGDLVQVLHSVTTAEAVSIVKYTVNQNVKKFE